MAVFIVEFMFGHASAPPRCNITLVVYTEAHFPLNKGTVGIIWNIHMYTLTYTG